MLLIFFSSAEAEELVIKPSVRLSEEYTDNIYLTESNRTHEYMTYVEPSINFSYKASHINLMCDYTLKWLYYSRLRKDDTSHLLNASAKSEIVNNFLYLELSDIYSRAIIEPRRPSTETNILINRTDMNIFTVSPYFKFQLTPTLSLSPGYKYESIWYKDPESVDRTRHTFFGNLEKTINPRTSIGFESAYTQDRPDDNKDNDQIANYVKISYRLTEKSNINLSGGYKYINFRRTSDKKRTIYNISLSRALEGGSVNLSIKGDTSASARQGIFEERSEEISVKYGIKTIFDLKLSHSMNNYLEINREDETYALGLGFTLRYERFQHLFGGGYIRYKFRPETEERDLYTLFTGIDYSITDKSNLSLNYSFTSADSTVDANDYSENVISIKFKYTF